MTTYTLPCNIYNKFYLFTQDVLLGQINLASDTLKLILTNQLPNPAWHSYSEVSGELATGNGYIFGGTATAISLSNTQGTEIVTATDVVWSAGGALGPFRYVIVYDMTSPATTLICWFDFQSELTLATGDTFTVEPSSNIPAGTLFALG